jgi:microcystin-dependent protein
MSTEPFIGEVKLFGFNFAPKGYQTCQGQILSIATNTALFSLLGTIYGGNGQTTFALPDLQGRAAVGQGQGPGLPSYTMGEKAGNTTVTILTSNMPAHIHTLNAARVSVRASSSPASEQDPTGMFPAVTTSPIYSDTPTTNAFTGGTVVSGTTDITGSGMPISIVNPYLCMNYSIAIQGIFPSRN